MSFQGYLPVLQGQYLVLGFLAHRTFQQFNSHQRTIRNIDVDTHVQWTIWWYRISFQCYRFSDFWQLYKPRCLFYTIYLFAGCKWNIIDGRRWRPNHSHFFLAHDQFNGYRLFGADAQQLRHGWCSFRQWEWNAFRPCIKCAFRQLYYIRRDWRDWHGDDQSGRHWRKYTLFDWYRIAPGLNWRDIRTVFRDADSTIIRYYVAAVRLVVEFGHNTSQYSDYRPLWVREQFCVIGSEYWTREHKRYDGAHCYHHFYRDCCTSVDLGCSPSVNLYLWYVNFLFFFFLLREHSADKS